MSDEVIAQIKHPAVASARRALGQASSGKAHAFLVEGPGMVSQALAARAPILAVFALAPEQLEEEERAALAAVREAGVPWHLVSRGVLFRLLGVGYETAARMLAVVESRPLSLEEGLARLTPESCFIVGERLQDPRNVGVLIRVADTVRDSLALFTTEGADPFSRPSVRSTTGSILRVPVVETNTLPQALQALRQRGVLVVGSSAGGASRLPDFPFRRPCALVVGNETTGLSEEARQACEAIVTIPMTGGAHSFNVTVAAGVLVYEVMRQTEPPA